MGKKRSITISIDESGAFSVKFSPSWHDLRPKDIDQSLKHMHRGWKQERANELIKARKEKGELVRKEAEEKEKLAALEAKKRQEETEKAHNEEDDKPEPAGEGSRNAPEKHKLNRG